MPKDFTCDYLVDITGLADNGENLYSCCHPYGPPLCLVGR